MAQSVLAPVSSGTAASLALRCLGILLASTSGLAILAKLYGVAPLRSATLWVALPCFAVLLAMGALAARSHQRLGNRRARLDDALVIGGVGGLLGTIGYDLFRVPFLMAGHLPFYPIEVYGMWLADARVSSAYTSLLGWSYHTFNGITFGIMYALAMPQRHWAWAIVWAMLLESIAIASPFLYIFNLAGNYPGIGIAYLGHLAYGVPLGLMVWKWHRSRSELALLRMRQAVVPVLLAGWVLLIAVPAALAPARLWSAAPTFEVEGIHLRPMVLRINRGQSVSFANAGDQPVTVLIRKTQAVAVPPRSMAVVAFPRTGTYQVYVDTQLDSSGYKPRTHSSLVIVEPVEQLD